MAAHLAQLMAAMQLTDSALPTGAFSHSLGFESYMDTDAIHDAATFSDWLRMFTAQQLTFTDAVAIRRVFAAESFKDIKRLDALVTALALPTQIRHAGMTMGQRLLAIAHSSYDSAWVEAYQRGVDEKKLHAHPALVWAVVARDLGITADDAVAHHVYASVISLTQNAVRAIPLGQNAGQRVIKEAQPWVEQAVSVSKELDEEDLGAAAPGLEIAQMNHERQRSRLFMS